MRSILGCRYPAERLEVIVVDNALGDRRGRGPRRGRVRRRRPVPRRAGARARASRTPATRGSQEATGEIVVFADDDVEVDRDWLATLVGPFARGERVGATSGMTLPGALETPAQRWVEGFGGRVRGFDTRVFDLRNPPQDQPLFPFTVGDLGAGRNMAFRRERADASREGSIRPWARARSPTTATTSRRCCAMLLSGAGGRSRSRRRSSGTPTRASTGSSSSGSGATASA